MTMEQVDHTSPEELAARNSHALMMFASHLPHGDPELENWFLDVEKILDDSELLHRAREKFLTPKEIQEIGDSLEAES